MKKAILLLFIFSACSKDNGGGGSTPASPTLLDKYWRAYDKTHNGASDPSVFSAQPTWQFRNDGRVYFTQTFPTYRDTFQYNAINNENIQLTKPWLSSGNMINLRINQLTDSEFDFTLTSNQNNDTDVYKTQKL